MSATPQTENQPLLAEFPPATPEAWKALVEAELKGAPFDKKMFTPTYEGITLRPIYRREDRPAAAESELPGFPPYTRGANAAGHAARAWEISQEIATCSPTEFNNLARASLQRGLTALNMALDRASRNGADPDWAQTEDVGVGGLSLASLSDLERALDGIDLATTPLFVRAGASGLPLGALMIALARRRKVDLAKLRGCVEMDPVGVLAGEGRLPQSLDGAYREMAAFTAWAAANAPALQTICVHSRAWHEAGGSAVQELAFALATGVEYLRELAARGLGVDVVAPRIRFAYTVGTRFFMEIAKLRAARRLWARAVEAAGGSAESQRATLHVRTSLFNKTVYDPHVNLLRTAVEAFAGVLGGCDSMQVGAFDEVARPPNEFSQRLARNQQLILRDECHLTQVADPAGGSWFIESLTDELSARAWALFQEVEQRGGMAKALREEFPQRAVAKVAEERIANVAKRRDSIIGTNVYANPAEERLEAPAADLDAFRKRRMRQIAQARTAADEAQHTAVLDRLAGVLNRADADLFEACVAAVEAGATLGEVTRAIRIEDQPDAPVTAARLTRAAAGFEWLRSAVDARAAALGRRPAVFLATMGPLKQHKARADFARGFFQVAGFEVEYPGSGFETPEAAVTAALSSAAEAICVCSTDETYPVLAPPLTKALRVAAPNRTLVLAGYPMEQVPMLQEAGIDEFIHLRCNALETLRRIARRMGVQL